MSEDEITELRAIIALQTQIKALEHEVSRRLAPFKDNRHFVVDGEIWELTRWGELEHPIRREMFSAWCLKQIGKAA